MNTYTKYFKQGCRERADEHYTYLADNTPEYMRDIVHDIHDEFDAMPNDWIYDVIYEAFDKLEDCNDIDNCTIEPDVYTNDLKKWFVHFFADDFVNEAYQDYDTGKSFLDVIAQGQCLAKQKIYRMVSEFIDQHKTEKDAEDEQEKDD